MYIPGFKGSDFKQKLKDVREGTPAPPPFGHYTGLPEGGELVSITPNEKIFRGVHNRYFAKSINTRELIEISPQSYQLTKDYSEYFETYEIFTLKWNNSQPLQDDILRGYLQRGSNYTNFTALVKLLPKYPELFTLVVNDGSFAARSYTPGKGFKTVHNAEYKGDIEYTADGKIYSPTRVRLFPIDKVITEFDK